MTVLSLLLLISAGSISGQRVTIPIFLARDTMRIGSHGIAVPHAYFKAAWCSGTDSIIGYWFFFNHK